MLRRLFNKYINNRKYFFGTAVKKLKETEIRNEVKKSIKQDDAKNQLLLEKQVYKYVQLKTFIEEIKAKDKLYTESEIANLYQEIIED